MTEPVLCANCELALVLDEERHGPYCGFCLEFGVNRPKSTVFEMSVAKYLHEIILATRRIG